jgi:prophage regulatory protein
MVTLIHPAPITTAASIAISDRILRLPEVEHRTGLSRATVYRRISIGHFPAAIPLGGKLVGWRESTINAWIASLDLAGAPT